jgi:hypothetical protein
MNRGGIIMKYFLAVCLIMAVSLTTGVAAAVTEEDFTAQTTRQLLNLCTASTDDPRHDEAVHFCHGYLLGALHYHMAENAGPEGKSLLCLPNPPPSRNEGFALFIEWVKAHPEHMDELPVETEFRFLMEKWPCTR